MDLADYDTSPNVDPLMKEIDSFGLFKHVAVSYTHLTLPTIYSV